MKKWTIWLAGIALLIPCVSWAQSYTETALLFSRMKPSGSARIVGMGGVQTSLGGDYSAAYSNPAGLGMFNRSEFTISPGFHNSSVNTDYLNTSVSDAKTNLHIPGFSLVFNTDQDGRKGFLSGTFGISYTRTNNFNQSWNYEGTNPDNSIIDFFLEEATGFPPNQFGTNGALENSITWLGYNNFLIGESTVLDPNNDPTQYFTDVQGIPFQAESVKTTGSQNQWSFSYGANLSDKVFLGAGFGISSIRFANQKVYGETFENEPVNSLLLQEDLVIRGSGVNASLGIIARPIDIVQVGISYTSPTIYNLVDSYMATMSTSWNNFDYYGDQSLFLNNESERTAEFITEYDLRTPSRVSVGATVFFEKYGFLSADVDMVNYNGARYSSGLSGISFNGENDEINNLYQSTFNYRIGGEARLNNFRARAGYSYQPDPFRTTQNNTDRGISSVSGGVGYRTAKFYLDFAVVLSSGNAAYRPYVVSTINSPVISVENRNTLALVTIGFPF